MNHDRLASIALSLGVCALAFGACSTNDGSPDVQAAAPALDEADEPQTDGYAVASAILHDASGARIGRIRFRSDGETTHVRVNAQLPESEGGTTRGIHVHANDDASNGEGCVADPAAPASEHFVSADGHYNPGDATHGGHAGDLPALILTHTGTAAASFITDRFQADELVGRAIVLHAKSDNYGNVPVGDAPNQYTPNSDEATDLTQRTGNAGDRYACGVIE
ncbi:MAG: superoxide dismutase family protein [Polyangiales bacterium]